MSAARHPGERPRRLDGSAPAPAPAPANMATLRSRRREAQRRRRLVRVELGLGVLGAAALLLAAPGLAIAGLIAGVVLAVCAASLVAQRWRSRRSARDARLSEQRPRRSM